MSVDNLKVFIHINMCYILPNDRQISNEGWSFDSINQYKVYGIGIFWLPQNIVTKMKILENCEECWNMKLKSDKWKK